MFKRRVSAERPTYHTEGEVRAWLTTHRVYELDVEAQNMAVIFGETADGTRSRIAIPKAIFRLFHDDLVWLHHTEGKLLPPNTLFALRSTLGRSDGGPNGKASGHDRPIAAAA